MERVLQHFGHRLRSLKLIYCEHSRHETFSNPATYAVNRTLNLEKKTFISTMTKAGSPHCIILARLHQEGPACLILRKDIVNARQRVIILTTLIRSALFWQKISILLHRERNETFTWETCRSILKIKLKPFLGEFSMTCSVIEYLRTRWIESGGL